VFGELDRNIPAALEHFMAERAHARRTIEIPGASPPDAGPPDPPARGSIHGASTPAARRGALAGAGRPARPDSGLRDQAELLEDGDAVVEPDLLGDETVLDAQHARPGEPHPPAEAWGSAPTGRSSNAGPVCVPPPSHWPTT
jgi:hypothetical protein